MSSRIDRKEGKRRPFAWQCAKDGKGVFVFIGDMGVQEDEKMGKKGVERERVRV